MHKRKDGKIIASLTEVKNKTGDIFALVDEFGEITLTSYNKPKYRITKVDILETLKIDNEEENKAKKEEKKEANKKTVVQKVVETLSPKEEVKEKDVPKIKEEKTPKVAKPQEVKTAEVKKVKDNKQSESLDSFTKWDRNNKAESAFTKKAIKPLQ